MSDLQNLTISTATITINVLKVDKHKMTKATFRQIPAEIRGLRETIYPGQGWLDVGKGNLEPGESVLGWVDDGDRWLLCVDNYKIKRFQLDPGGDDLDELGIEQLYIAT